MSETLLDQAHATMEASPEDDAKRLRFYERVLDAELFLLLEREADGDAVEPQAFNVEGTAFVLAVDLETRLADFSPGAAFAAMSGRNLVALLAGEELGLGLNLDVAPSAFLMPPEGVSWLAQTAGEGPREVAETPDEIMSPRGVPEPLLVALSEKLLGVPGAALGAYLVSVRYKGGRAGHILAFVDPAPGAEAALAQGVQEALAFSGVEAGTLDVAFFDKSDPISAKLALVGLRFDLPELNAPAAPTAPGLDPDKPPKLR